MESTLLRMQAELTAVAEENASLRIKEQAARHALQRQKSSDCKDEKESVGLTRRIAGLEEELEQLAQEKTKLAKDRDAAVSTLVKVKSDSAKKNSDAAVEAKRKDDQILTLKRRCLRNLCPNSNQALRHNWFLRVLYLSGLRKHPTNSST